MEIRLCCQELGGESLWLLLLVNRPDSIRERENQRLQEKLKEIHHESRGTYGLPRLKETLKHSGYSCGKERIRKIMKKAGISGLIKKRFQVKTTDSKHSNPIAPRIFKTEEASTFPTRANQLWASDISYIPTQEGFLYLATYLDVCTRKVVSFCLGETMETSLILSALEMAMGRQSNLTGALMSHSDRGSQCASEEYRKRLEE